ncbi:hypothetical protein PAP_08145 [Palaeococcus pacificus DY20341]|uniref:Uncharacterized protein n=1 Tax=Palaeococcus pacificus DY20341 TaxID=1343739 RepID=A0A075LVH9_9EURY|nr:ATPase [Palaeococcus pacificus]AIF70017.1 hypothetical protein PAP_08145 [Palaeococcus pacificus DY20341]
MKLILKPLFDAELPSEFVDILKAKLLGREIKEGQEIEVELLGKPLRFRVVYAEPKVLKADKSLRIELTGEEISSVTLEFEKPVRELIALDKSFAVVFDDEVLILNHKGHKIYNQKFEELKDVMAIKNSIVVIHNGGKKLTLIALP